MASEQTQNVVGDDVGEAIVKKLQQANQDLVELANNIQTSIDTLIQKVKTSKTLSDNNKTELQNALQAESQKVVDAMKIVGESKNREDKLIQQLESISKEVNSLENNINQLKENNKTQKVQIDEIGNTDGMDGGYQYKNPRSKRKLNKNNRFGVLKTKSKSKSKKGKKKRKLGKGKKSMRGGMKKRTKSKRKSKNSKKTRKRRKKNKRK